MYLTSHVGADIGSREQCVGEFEANQVGVAFDLQARPSAEPADIDHPAFLSAELESCAPVFGHKLERPL
ncbi:MAG: hypothetical protein M3416_20170 [Acidobacteriota bacterium]|nr:hypothetical protein [Acidobacteriota bacterium]